MGFQLPGSSVRDLFGCFIRDPFRGENVTSIWVIKRSLGRSWYNVSRNTYKPTYKPNPKPSYNQLYLVISSYNWS